jgi:hypothetical protein
MFKAAKSLAAMLLYACPIGQTIDYVHMFGHNLSWFSLSATELDAGTFVAILWVLTIGVVEYLQRD